MDHGLSQFEARERFIWFLFWVLCLLMALPAVWIHLAVVPRTPVMATTSETIKTYGFWAQRHWMHIGPLGKVLAYLAWVAVLFIVIRFLWLIAQFMGKRSLLSSLHEGIASMKRRQTSKLSDSTNDLRNKPYAGFGLMVSRLNHPSRFLFHAFRRAQNTLPSTAGMPFTDGLIERQLRLSNMDQRMFKSSWTAFRWIVRLLPVLAALQSFWLIYSVTPLFLGKQDELEQFAYAFCSAMLPLVQLTVLAVFVGLASAFLSRMESLYLANLDTSLFDHMVSELPIRSSDTLLILQSLQKHFLELQDTLKNLVIELKNDK